MRYIAVNSVLISSKNDVNADDRELQDAQSLSDIVQANVWSSGGYNAQLRIILITGIKIRLSALTGCLYRFREETC